MLKIKPLTLQHYGQPMSSEVTIDDASGDLSVFAAWGEGAGGALNLDDARGSSGTIKGGMMPKVEACITALDGGAKKAHIIDGRIEHSLLLEIYTYKGIGTQIIQ